VKFYKPSKKRWNMFAVPGDIKDGLRKTLLVVIFKDLPQAKRKSTSYKDARIYCYSN